MRRWVLWWMAAVCWASLPAAAAEGLADPALYRCKVYLTGTDMRSRPEGLARCVRDVLVKVTGDPDVAENPKLLGLAAAGLVQDFAYLDRMSDQPHHDEQGTRDRPFDLIGHVDPAGVARLLRTLGRTAWTGPRPVLFVVAQSHNGGERFAITADGEEGERQRQALLAAGERYGMRVSVPTVAQLEGMSRAAPDVRRLPIAKGPGGAVALVGALDWSDADAGWVCRWTLLAGGRRQVWEVRGVSFDEGFRAGVGGAAKRLAGARR